MLLTDLQLWSSYLKTLGLVSLACIIWKNLQRSILWEVRPWKLKEVSDVLKWAYFMEVINCFVRAKKGCCFFPMKSSLTIWKTSRRNRELNYNTFHRSLAKNSWWRRILSKTQLKGTVVWFSSKTPGRVPDCLVAEPGSASFELWEPEPVTKHRHSSANWR